MNRSKEQRTAKVNVNVEAKGAGSESPDGERPPLLEQCLSARDCCCLRGSTALAPGLFIAFEPIKPVGVSGSPCLWLSLFSLADPQRAFLI